MLARSSDAPCLDNLRDTTPGNDPARVTEHSMGEPAWVFVASCRGVILVDDLSEFLRGFRTASVMGLAVTVLVAVAVVSFA
jgi:hypothetical protein